MKTRNILVKNIRPGELIFALPVTNFTETLGAFPKRIPHRFILIIQNKRTCNGDWFSVTYFELPKFIDVHGKTIYRAGYIQTVNWWGLDITMTTK